MTSFEELRATYPDLPPAYPSDWPAPLLAYVYALEKEFRVSYSEEFVEFQDIECHRTPLGSRAQLGFGWANPNLFSHRQLVTVLRDARHCGVDPRLAAFHKRDGNFTCCDPTGKIVIWEPSSKKPSGDPAHEWPSFIAWLASTLDADR